MRLMAYSVTFQISVFWRRRKRLEEKNCQMKMEWTTTTNKKRKFSRTLTALPEHHSNSFFSLFTFLNTFFFKYFLRENILWGTFYAFFFAHALFNFSCNSVSSAMICLKGRSICVVLQASQLTTEFLHERGTLFIIFHPWGICNGEKIWRLTYPS